MTRLTSTGISLLGVVFLTLGAASSLAATPVADITSSADGLVALGGGATVLGADSAVSEDPPGASNFVDLGVLPASADVDALHLDANGLASFSLDQPADLGGTFAEPGDVAGLAFLVRETLGRDRQLGVRRSVPAALAAFSASRMVADQELLYTELLRTR